MMRAGEPGTYILVIELVHDAHIRVASLGAIQFVAGSYLYVGSALGGLEARLARHLRQEKRLHWHIDYLLRRGRIREVWYHSGPEHLECVWARALARAPGVSPFASPFGASDCGCHAHLFHSEAMPTLEAFQTHLSGRLVAKQIDSLRSSGPLLNPPES